MNELTNHFDATIPEVSETDLWNYDIGMTFAPHVANHHLKAPIYAHLNNEITNWERTVEDVMFVNGTDDQLTF